MRNYTGNSLTEEEKNRLRDISDGMSQEEVREFLSAVDSKYLWSELMRRETEAREKLNKVFSFLNSNGREIN